MTLPENTHLCGRYRLQDSIGRGGMADVYRAFDEKRQAPVAVKILREDLAEDPDFVRRFRREAEALARLDHPNVVRFYAFEQDGPVAFIVMDYIEGTTLRRHLLEQRGPLKIVALTAILRDLCGALHYAHLNGIVHRDLKPGNVMLKRDGTAMLTDFGIARAGAAITMTAPIMGTPPYMSPEQCEGAEPDARSDIYSLGVLLFEMATGRRPFTGEEPGLTETGTPARIQEAHLRLPPPEPRSLNSRLPAAASDVIMRALAKRPTDRWPDAVSLREAWEAAVGVESPNKATVPAGARVGARDRSRPRTSGRAAPRWALALAGLALVAAIAVAAQAFGGTRTGSLAQATPPVTARATTTAAPSVQPSVVPRTAQSTRPSGGVVQVAHPTSAAAAPTPEVEAPTVNASSEITATIAISDTQSLPGEPTVIPTLIMEPTRTPTATIAISDTQSLPGEPTRIPTRTVEPTRTPYAPPTPRPTGTQPPPPAATARPGVGGVALISPPPNEAINGPWTFQWEEAGGFALRPGELYELIFWRPGEDGMRDGRSPIAAIDWTWVKVNLAVADVANDAFGTYFDPGPWNWGIALRDAKGRVRMLSDGRPFTFDRPSSGGGTTTCDPNVDPGCKP